VDLARQAFALRDDDVLRVLSRLDTGVVDAEPGAQTGGQIGGARFRCASSDGPAAAVGTARLAFSRLPARPVR
jgi:hypothetical protein